MRMVFICMAAGRTLLPLGTAQAQAVVTGDGDGGVTPYAFDRNAEGKFACYWDCARIGPPYRGSSDEEKQGLDRGRAQRRRATMGLWRQAA
ncbi:hypothetical protein [Paracoccus versutus]